MYIRHSWKVGLAVVIASLFGIPAIAQEVAPSDISPDGQLTFPRLQRIRNAIPSQYIVVFNDGVSWEEVRQIASGYQRRNRRILHMYGKVLNGFAIRLSEREAQELSQDERVKYVQEDVSISRSQTTSSCSFPAADGHVPKCVSQSGVPWNMDRLNQTSSTLDNSFSWSGTGKNVNVYVVDTGILTTHTEFQGRATAVFDAINDGYGNTDCDGHGTFVAGLIGGYTFGIAKEVNLKSVRVLDCKGKGSSSGIIAGINWITSNAVRPAVVNVSLGGSANSALDSAVVSSINTGIVYVVAAGNDNKDAADTSPARVTQAITVGAVDQAQSRASFSNYGSVVDFYVPGVDTCSAYNLSNTSAATGSGTSMAAPIVAGMAAVALEWNPDTSIVYNSIYTTLFVKSNLTVNMNVPKSGSQPTDPPSDSKSKTNEGRFKSYGIPIIR
jgi:aqualysin 1